MSDTGKHKTAETIANEFPSSVSPDILPVFRGLDDISISGKEIANIVGVTAPTFSKWRSGRAKVPECKLVFLTLLLAHWIDEMAAQQSNRDRRDNPRLESKLKTILRCLLRQENLNQALSPESVREGSHLFRQWWFEEGERSSGMSKMAS